ncbi:TnpV protein [Agathobaculum sp. Marseille-P7918]|uniref:TnpV protein n=1 Tax=Agathobaculum sp. Marseille-P7918 TaxID=2479843 RepID=UPI00356847D4
MSIQEQLNKAMSEDRQCHLGTDGKQYHDPTPAHYLTFGVERLQYMKRKEPEFYQEMVVAGKLNEYLNDVEVHAQEELEQITLSMAQQERTDEELKATDPMKWLGLMNNYRYCAAEIVRENWVYS